MTATPDRGAGGGKDGEREGRRKERKKGREKEDKGGKTIQSKPANQLNKQQHSKTQDPTLDIVIFSNKQGYSYQRI